ncbi:polysaccharide lyase family 14 protein [Gelatoporia subvermispora B]|uniref:Polysaccharide lyase family 14 protein n=1 Tax=Ceriporiopsis subvermispora (strain B) TaxID=914234 RepID=M2RHH1_CERS8|nr:polysaccharide lyase family 14 protein [Gelatoporia subvermispora B]
MISSAIPLALLYTLVSFPSVCTAQVVPPSQVAQLYSLSTSTSLPFPTATLSSSDAQSFLVSSWGLGKGHIQNGADELEFVSDPFPNAPAPDTGSPTSGPVLQVTYPAGSFSNGTGGAQFYNLWNTTDGSQFQTMLLSYEVAFDSDFNFVKGGKLPGLRGGSVVDGCDGGDAANGSNCFSTRLMWRTSGAGEVYSYILNPNDECSNADFICNSDGFGTSIDRGSFSFLTGQWNAVTLLVSFNSPNLEANGQVAVYYNNVLALDERSLQYRNSSSVTIGGLFFSTFFGGDDSSWATPQTVHTYFRNFQMWGSSSPSNISGPMVSGAPPAAGNLGYASVITTLVLGFAAILGTFV